jgi:TolA-binding protein
MRRRRTWCWIPLLVAALGAPAGAAAAKSSKSKSSKSKSSKAGADDDAPPMTSYQLEMAIQSREKTIGVDRKRAIGLLEEFIAKHSSNRAMPEAYYRLAALYWERSQETFLTSMKSWADGVDACRAKPESCPEGPPEEPQLDLSESQTIYVRLIDKYPTFRKIDTVHYLYGFSLRDQGKPEDAQKQFWAIINDHPQSTFVPDAWLAVGDHRFYVDNDFAAAREAYAHVLDHPDSDPYPMALFKTAWCHWKLGQSDQAIQRFKEVLDQGADEGQDADRRQALADLREEALEYLVQVISEDEKYTPADIHGFLVAIDGEKYSRKVLVRLGEAYEAQTRYDKSVPTWRFLIALDADHADNARFQLHVVTGVRGDGGIAKALDELTVLSTTYGPQTKWGKAHPKPAKKVNTRAGVVLYDLGRSVHESAQAAEKDTKVPDKERYGLAARAYSDYTQRYPANPNAVEAAYLTGDIYYFKLGRPEEAGDAYLRVGESAPVGKLHHDALIAAIAAYEEAMEAAPPPAPVAVASAGTPVGAGPAGKAPAPESAGAGEPDADADADGLAPEEPIPEEPPPDDGAAYTKLERKFIRAVDLFAALFPEDEEIGAVLYKLGEFFYAREDFDNAISRFGMVVVDHPRSANAGAAGDRILESLNKAEDYDKIELWAGKLKTAPAFEEASEQQRLDRIIVDSLLKQGDTMVDRGYHARAAGYYLRVSKEFPKHDKAPMALSNAGAALERSGQARDATAAYQQLIEDHPKSKPAAQATLVVARVFENMADYREAAKHYDLLVERYPKHEARSDALYNAGVLYQSLGEYDTSIERLRRYGKEYPNSEDAPQVRLRVAEVQAKKGDHKAAISTLKQAAAKQKGPGEAKAQLLLGRSLLESGQRREADKALAKSVKAAVATGGEAKLSGAEARYLQGEVVYAQFVDAKLDSKPSKLGASLDKKAKLLGEAKNIYLDVLSFGAPEWSTAALYRVGEAYEGFAKGLREYPMPKGLSQDEEDAYNEQLDTFALAFEEEAIGAYRSGYAKALELGIYNAHTRNIRQALGRLSSAEFPPIAEAGTDLRVAEDRRASEPIRRLAR